MIRHAVLALGCALGLIGTAAAQQIRTYTATETGPNFLTYGLPVPRPIESLTPVDGFRSYASLEARLQGLALGSADLSAHDVGRTFNGRPLWAYVASDADGIDVEGRPEAAFFINAATHAREWGAPEVSTGTIERLLAGAGDGGFTRYLLDNTRLVIIPVHNIDGLLQTQRFPTDVVVGQDPTSPNTWPRDGRMRRKNMRGVDEVLTTFADHLGGVDLNRNHPPFWATSIGQGGSSTDPNSLTFHGSAPHSEPENLALERAAELGPVTRFRLGIDVHSFSSVFFSTNTARTRLNEIQARLIANLGVHHQQLSGKFYTDVPDPPNRGIGVAAEYFAYTWLVPAWTLELEPEFDAREYGGTNVTHSGFILPASQARRVRESWAETHSVAFYMMAGPPHLSRLRIFDVQTNALVRETRWQYDPQSGRRALLTTVPGSLQPGARYRAELAFSKPMRRRDAAGTLTPLPGLFVTPQPQIALLLGAQRTPLDSASGVWLSDPARVLRYRDDTFAFEFTAPAQTAEHRFEVAVSDMTGLALDADPASPADWSNGAWSEWEDSAGVDGDLGGVDRNAALSVSAASNALVEILSDARVVGEGDTVQLRLRRPQPGPERVEIVRRNPNGELSPPPAIVAAWQPGEAGDRTVPVTVADDVEVQGDRDLRVLLDEVVNGAGGTATSLAYRVLDNDTQAEAAVRLRRATAIGANWEAVRTGATARHLVLDGNLTYVVPIDNPASPTSGLLPVQSQLQISGNGAALDVAAPRRDLPAFDVAPQGRLTLDQVRLNGHAATRVPTTPVLRSAGNLTLARTQVASDGAIDSDLIESSGTLRIDRSLIRVLTNQNVPLRITGGAAVVATSTVAASEGFPVARQTAGGLKHHSASWLLNSSGATLFSRGVSASVPEFGHTLIQDNTVSTNLSPPVLENCDLASQSLGYNIEDFTRCGFGVTGDRSGLDLGEFSFDAAIGGYAPIGLAIDGGATAALAAATGCGTVDQRGAPRPQTLTAGAVPRCDIGAIELGVNPYRGIWQPDRSGHGVELHTSGNQLLLVWYTYADDGQPTSYQAVAPLTGPHWEADLLLPRRDLQSGIVTTPRVGRVTIDFTTDTDARIGWRFDARGTTGSERIRPAVFANGEPRFEVTGVWYPPAESGYGATITRRGETTAIVLYYYDALGNIRWVLGAGNAADALDLEMSSFTGFCPDCSAATMPVVGRPAGRLLAHFHTPGRARLDTQIVYPGTAGGSWNRDRASLVPINDRVDNRAAAATLAQ